MDGLDPLARLRSARHVGLVGDHDEPETRALQEREGFRDAGQDFQILHGLRRIGKPVADHGTVDHAVPVEEHRARVTSLVDSHFVGLAFSCGCDTSRCQITA